MPVGDRRSGDAQEVIIFDRTMLISIIDYFIAIPVLSGIFHILSLAFSAYIYGVSLNLFYLLSLKLPDLMILSSVFSYQTFISQFLSMA